jgi:hypothetical protein
MISLEKRRWVIRLSQFVKEECVFETKRPVKPEMSRVIAGEILRLEYLGMAIDYSIP